MFTKLRNSNLADTTLSRKGFTLSHTFSALLVWAITITTSGNKFFLLITDSLTNSFKRFDGAHHPTDLFTLNASGSNPVIRAVNSLLDSLSVLFVPLLPRNKAGVPVTPPHFKDFEGELHYITPDPKTILIWFGTAILMIFFLVLVMDYVYEFLGILVMFSSNSGPVQVLAIIMGIILVAVWLIALYARLRDTNAINPNWSLFVVAFVGYFIYTMSLDGGNSLIRSIIIVIGLLVSSYIGFCAMFMGTDYDAALARKARHKDRRYIKLVRKGKV